ncbi:MAG: hypothetical protein RL672_147 [Actinomycetota bacterium]|jgi:hypothetical protein
MELQDWPSQVFSKPRFGRYLKSTRGDEVAALALYRTELHEAMQTFQLLSLLEVGLRNGVCSSLEIEGGLWHEVLGATLRGRNALQLQAAQKSRGSDSRDQMVTAMSFGFWCSLFSAPLEPVLWSRYLSKIGSAQESLPRRQIAGALWTANKLRNRIAHHEPIAKPNLSSQVHDIQRVIAWLSRDLAYFAESLNPMYSDSEFARPRAELTNFDNS